MRCLQPPLSLCAICCRHPSGRRRAASLTQSPLPLSLSPSRPAQTTMMTTTMMTTQRTRTRTTRTTTIWSSSGRSGSGLMAVQPQRRRPLPLLPLPPSLPRLTSPSSASCPATAARSRCTSRPPAMSRSTYSLRSSGPCSAQRTGSSIAATSAQHCSCTRRRQQQRPSHYHHHQQQQQQRPTEQRTTRTPQPSSLLLRTDCLMINTRTQQ